MLTLVPRYCDVPVVLEHGLYLRVRRRAGRQSDGWTCDLPHVYRKSAARSPYTRFVFEIRRLIAADTLPGYRLRLETDASNVPVLRFSPDPSKDTYPQDLVDNHVEDS